MLDVIQKMQVYIEDFKIYPTSFVVNFRNMQDQGKMKSKTYPMLPMEEFLKNPSQLLKWPIPLFKEHEHQLLPARTLGATVTNFKSIDQIKKESS